MWDLCGWLGEVGGLFGNFSKSQKYLWLCWYFILYKVIERGKLKFISALSLLIPISLLPHHFHLLPSFSLLKICSTYFLLTFKVCFLSFYTCSSCFMRWLLMGFIQILRNVLLSWIYVCLIWNIKDLRLSSKKCERVEKLRKENT